MTDDDFSAEELEQMRRERIIDEARRTITRLEREEEQRDEAASLPPAELAMRLIGSPPDRNERWRIEGEAFARECEQARAELAASSRQAPSFDWNIFDERVLLLIARDREAAVEAIAEATVELISEAKRDTIRTLCERVNELKVEIAKLGSESAALHEAIAVERCRAAGVEVLSAKRVN
ncbi:MAG TPA: hypothetical protein VGI22_13150 [Xanthobacteraceae bacterium]